MRRSAGKSGGGVGAGVKSAVVDRLPGVMHGAKASTTIGCKTDEDDLDGLLNAPSHQFAFGRFMGLANALGWVTSKATADQPTSLGAAATASMGVEVLPAPALAELTLVLTLLNTHLKKVHAALPPRTALVIFTGHSDPRRMSLLNARKNALESALKSERTPEEIGTGGGV